MLVFILRRLLAAIPVLFGITVLVFLMLHLIPGDPAQILLFGSGATPAQVANLDKQLGLTGSIFSQYGHYVVQLLHGNLGYSYAVPRNGPDGDPPSSCRTPSSLALARARGGPRAWASRWASPRASGPAGWTDKVVPRGGRSWAWPSRTSCWRWCWCCCSR